MAESALKKVSFENNEYLPAFHITGGEGWINDPNGLVFFNGEYHVFYQYYPHDTKWGPMHWGHVVSNDLTNWKRLPVALAPGGVGDKDGCFSGTAIVAFGKLFLMYTGFEENGGGENVRQVQCLAESSDGVYFRKHGVVIGSDALPDGYMPCDFRDPHVFYHDGNYYCLVAAKKKGGRGNLLLYVSSDLFNWTIKSDALGFESDGIMFECPCFMEKAGLIAVCDQFPVSRENGCLNVHSARYFLGKMDYTAGRFLVDNEGILDYGFDYYAPQCFAGSGDTVVIGWLNMWDRNVPSAKYGFAGMLTVPRKLTVQNGQVWQTPIVKKRKVFEREVDGTLEDRAVAGVIEISAEGAKEFEISLRRGGDNETIIRLDGDSWVFDRSRSGEAILGAEKDELSLAGKRRMPQGTEGKTKITIVLDKYSVEFFEGGKVASSTIYPPLEADGIKLKVKAKSCVYTRYDIAD